MNENEFFSTEYPKILEKINKNIYIYLFTKNTILISYFLFLSFIFLFLYLKTYVISFIFVSLSMPLFFLVKKISLNLDYKLNKLNLSLQKFIDLKMMYGKKVGRYLNENSFEKFFSDIKNELNKSNLKF
ncbi:hypothetical protein OSSY52_06850 [Tepiditoga spiralis]|uniref:Uncharacterized protein n=1 Tax=Tepiditoga spiralis TaxID=2108365 RepID=A0A7G1G623_9BACT|nr:hypothetical protein [Tepiditoga spiralis]BBE30544.1 hypothetical protein OSSY52_06850 [Tepiditoga spiralis]